MTEFCEICGRPKKIWFALGGRSVFACSKISCGESVKPVRTVVKKVVKKSRIKKL